MFPTIPPRVDYDLTPLGRSLLVPVMALGAWAQANIATIDAARRKFDGLIAPAEVPVPRPAERAA